MIECRVSCFSSKDSSKVLDSKQVADNLTNIILMKIVVSSLDGAPTLVTDPKITVEPN